MLMILKKLQGIQAYHCCCVDVQNPTSENCLESHRPKITFISVSLYDLVAVLFESYLIVAAITHCLLCKLLIILPSCRHLTIPALFHTLLNNSALFPSYYWPILPSSANIVAQSCPLPQTLLPNPALFHGHCWPVLPSYANIVQFWPLSQLLLTNSALFCRHCWLILPSSADTADQSCPLSQTLLTNPALFCRYCWPILPSSTDTIDQFCPLPHCWPILPSSMDTVDRSYPNP